MIPESKNFFRSIGGTLLGLLVFSSTLSFSYANDLTSNLIAHYPLDGNASDISGNNLHGNVSGAIPTQDRFGQSGMAYWFDGVDDFIRVNHSSILNLSPNLTLSIWFSHGNQTPSRYEDLIMKGNSSFGFQYSANGDRILFQMRGGGSYKMVIPDSMSLSNQTWYHLVGTRDTAVQSLYLNGVLLKQNHWAGNFSNNTNDLLFGYKIASDNNWYFGALDNTRLYNRALNGNEVLALYNLENTPPNTTPYDLNSTAALAFSENQPIGTMVGEFNATDPDANAILTYSLVSGSGDGNNSLFTLETNGTLKTATTFDFESNASSYSIRVQVKDEFNATAEGSFTVSLTDLYEPSQPNHFVDLNSSINLEMIWVEPGTFMMGQSNISGASPVHQVTLTKGFYLGKHEVTQAQYEAVMKGNGVGLSSAPSTFGGNPNHPVERVSHNDIQIFLQRLNDQEAHNLPAGWKYVLPTEAQWEYACRAGSTTVYSWGNTLAADNANWNHGSDPNQTMDVGQYTPNAWGFHDMHGNVYEWTADWHAPYTSNAKTDPEGPASAAGRSNRGGSWTFDGTHLPVARRFSNLPTDRFNYIGFRLAYRQITMPPSDLNSTAALAFSENQPIGTVVGEFNASDPDLKRRFTQGLGTKVWEFETGGSISSKPALASNGMVFFGSKDNKFYALDLETGAELWKFTGSDSICKPAIGHNGRVYVGTLNGKIYSFDFQGNKLWEFATGDRVVAAPTLDGNGKLYVGSCDNKFYALNCIDGSKIWEFNASSKTHTKAILSKDGKLFFGTDGSTSKFFALNSSDGSKIWEFTVAQKIWSSPALGLDGTVYFGCHDGKIYALDPGDGSLIWTHNAQSAVAGPVTLGYDDSLFAVTSSGKLLALDSKTGTQKWAFNTGSSGTRNTPTVASDNSVYFGDKNGKLYSINGNDGTKLWDLQVGNEFDVSSPCIAPNGKLLIGSQNNKLYCVQASAPLASDAVWPAYGFDNKKTGSRKPHLTYHLVSGPGDGNNSLFMLDQNGTLKTATTFDYESNPSIYSIRVRVKDELNASVEGNFTVNLINQNEAPVFTNLLAAPYPVVKVQENQKAVTTLTGTDPDGHLLEFILTGPDAHLFELNATTGSLSFLNPPDYESPTDQDSNNSYEIGIFLKESNFSSESTFLAFENFDYPLGEIVGRNGGLGWNGAWQGGQSWQVVDGNVIVDQTPAKGRQILMGEQHVKVRRFFQNPITIGDQAGEHPNIWTMVAIHFKQLVNGHSIDFRLKGSSQQAPIVIGKKSNGGIALSYDHVVSDISGALGAKQFALNLRYDQDGNTSLKLYAIGDRTLNQMQTFNPNDMKSFASKVFPGKINLEQIELYRHNNTQSTIDEIAVFAGELSDDNDGDGISNWDEYLLKRIHLYAEKNLRIEVADQNDPPSTLNFTAPLAFAENQPIGTVVGEFNATDPDAGATLTYSLVSGAGDGNNSLFTLDQNGTLKTATTFDYESNASGYSIRVQAKDEFNATTEANFTVMLTDVDEPFVMLSYEGNVTAQVDALENQPFGAFAEAFDPEGVPITYAITGGIDQGLFEINASSGVVSFKSTADFENPNDADGDNRYEVQVLAQCNSQSLAQNYLIQVVDVQDSTLPANGYRLLATGNNNRGQFGNDSNVSSLSFVETISHGVAKVSGGQGFALVLKTDGSLWAMGKNSDGQIGDGSTTDRWTPTLIEPSGVIEISAGGMHSLYLKSNGSLWGMGKNNQGQLGLGDTNARLSPALIVDTNVTKLSAGHAHNLFIKEDGSLWGFGDNTNGRLGDGTTVDRHEPIKIIDSGVSSVSAGSGHTLFSKTDGSLWSMGNGGQGRLGTVSTNGRKRPTRVFEKGVISVAAGWSHSLALKSDGSLWAFGENTNGRLGDGTANARHSPKLTVQEKVTEIFAGASHSALFKEDGRLRVMGRNSDGQLGLGHTWSRYNPSPVNSHIAYRASASGNNTYILTLPLNSPPVFTGSSTANIPENQTFAIELNASDPDGDSLTYSIAGGLEQAKFDLNASTGVLTFKSPPDYEANASSSGNNIYSVVVQVSDGTLDANQTVTIHVTDVYETHPNSAPTDLNSTAPLTIAENQPVGTFVGQFTAHDPDANASLSYRLANGPGSKHNDHFSLDANETLRTAKVFDYENRTTFKIRVQVADEHNVSIQEAFIVSVIDLVESNATTPDGNGTQVLPGDSNSTDSDDNTTQPGTPTGDFFQPIVETGKTKKVSNDSATLRGSLVDNGGARITERGFLLSAKPNPKPGRKNVTRLDANGSKNFQAQATELKPGKKYYYRAFATNAQGTALGSVESFTTTVGPPSPSWINAQPGAAANWWSSRWFGNFYLNANGWARHEQLGWVFPMESATAGLWLWKRDLGWLWTDKEIYPFLYQNAQGGWLYFYGQRKGTLLFYDYEAKRWISKQDSQ